MNQVICSSYKPNLELNQQLEAMSTHLDAYYSKGINAAQYMTLRDHTAAKIYDIAKCVLLPVSQASQAVSNMGFWSSSLCREIGKKYLANKDVNSAIALLDTIKQGDERNYLIVNLTKDAIEIGQMAGAMKLSLEGDLHASTITRVLDQRASLTDEQLLQYATSALSQPKQEDGMIFSDLALTLVKEGRIELGKKISHLVPESQKPIQANILHEIFEKMGLEATEEFSEEISDEHTRDMGWRWIYLDLMKMNDGKKSGLAQTVYGKMTPDYQAFVDRELTYCSSK